VLKRLETQLGARLFERSTRAMRLTAPGQILLAYAQRAFELLAEGQAQLDAERGELVGAVRVSAPSDLACTVLLPMLDEFLRLHPGVRLALNVGDRVLDVLRDEVDVAIRYGDRPFDSWRCGQHGQWTTVRVSGDRLVDDASLDREWAVAHAGIILMTDIEQKNDLMTGSLVPLLTEWETQPYSLHALLPSGRFVPNRVLAFVDFIADRFSAPRAAASV